MSNMDFKQHFGISGDKSEFNQSISKIMRIDLLQRICHISRLEGINWWSEWREALRGIHAEIYEMMTQEEHNKAKQQEQNIDFAFSKIMVNKTLRYKLYSLLFDYELFLNKTMNLHELGLKKQEENKGDSV